MYSNQDSYTFISQILDCQPGNYYIPSPAPLARGRFSLKNWWSKEWYEAWSIRFDPQDLTELRSRARQEYFAGICIAPGAVRAAEQWNIHYRRFNSSSINLKFQIWTEEQINAVADYLNDHPLEAVRLLDGHLSHDLSIYLELSMIPFFLDLWIDNHATEYVYSEVILAYIVTQMIDQDPMWLFIIHGFGTDRLYAIFGEDITHQKNQFDDASEFDINNFWVSKDIAPQFVSQRQPLLSRHVSGLPDDFRKAVKSVAEQAKNAAENVLHTVQRPTWEPTPLFQDNLPIPAMPELTVKQTDRLEAIRELTDDFYLQSYEDERDVLNMLTQRLLGLALVSPKCSFIHKGYAKTWACAVAALFTRDLESACTMFEVSINTTPERVEKICQGLGIHSQDRRWMTPQQRAEDPRGKLWRSSHGLIVRQS